jgi:hypothetical protein
VLNLKTCFCHGCGAFMECPYQSTVDQELYHKFCLPETKLLNGVVEGMNLFPLILESIEEQTYLENNKDQVRDLTDEFQDRLNPEWRQPNDSPAES